MGIVHEVPPPGFEALNVHNGTQDLWAQGATRQVCHLITAGKPTLGTLCGKSLFGPSADLSGWSRGGGVFGPGIEQVKCQDCWAAIEPGTLTQ